MARQKCRDCTRCTESAMKGCLVLPIRIFLDAFRMVFVFPFAKMCPVCKHPLAWHGRTTSGQFHD